MNFKKIWNKNGWTILLIFIVIIFVLSYILQPDLSNCCNFNYLFKKHKLSKTSLYQTSLIYDENSENMSKGEYACKVALEKIFRRPFYKIRPEFMKNNVTGKNLELDLYNPELKLCIEMNGKQHYHYTPFFHKNNEAFLNQKYRDEIKKFKCRDNGINLIEVPYTVKTEEIENYLIGELRKLNYSV